MRMIRVALKTVVNPLPNPKDFEGTPQYDKVLKNYREAQVWGMAFSQKRSNKSSFNGNRLEVAESPKGLSGILKQEVSREPQM